MIIKNKIITFFVLSTLLLVPIKNSHADAGTRLATVDVNRILNGLKESKDKRKELDKISSSAKKKIETKRDALKELESKLKKGKVSPESKEAEKFREQAREYERLVKDTEEDLRRRYMKINQSLTEKALGAVEKYAKKNNIELVLDKSEKIRGPVLFGNKGADITDAVIKEMNS